jgi:hypothetical protein
MPNPQQKESPGSALAGPEAQFKSRYADPNHAANSGSLISLVTGGAINPLERKDRRRAARREMIGIPARDRTKGSMVQRALQENVAYLMIVNMPSEEELAVARAKLAAPME